MSINRLFSLNFLAAFGYRYTYIRERWDVLWLCNSSFKSVFWKALLKWGINLAVFK